MLGRIIAGLVVAIAVAFGAFYAWAWHGEIAPASTPAALFDPGVVAKGAKLAAIGNCGTCHTQAGGKPYAGGFPVETPFGTVYGSNITPDPETGIGSWSQAAFQRALREGVSRRGDHLYPAFPYDHFRHMSDGDIAALYAFMMTRQPVALKSREPELTFPMNIRLSAAAWKLIFLRGGGIARDTAKSEEWNRGAYLVAGIGHCGSCHTPRNAFGAEKKSDEFAGGMGEGWRAPGLGSKSPAPAPWTQAQLYTYLRDGFADQHGVPAGPMQPVVRNLQKADDADVRAMATYISTLGNQDRALADRNLRDALDFAHARAVRVPGATGSATTGSSPPANADPAATAGAAIFAGACATCHRSGGGLPIARPVALGLSTAVNAPEPTGFVRTVLDGIHPPPDEAGRFMPSFNGTLTDAQIIALATYVRAHYSRQPPWANVAATLSQIRRQPTAAMEAP